MNKFPFPLPPRYKPTGERLGGGQGYVYVCQDEYLDRKVAIKVMHSRGDDAQLKKELRALCDIRSPHVAQVYDLVSSKGGTLGLVQEYVPGESLDEYGSQDTLASNEFVKILYQIASGLSDIHSNKKVHRDIKPHNMRFDSEQVVKILDFGLTADLTKTETTKARGTDGFLAPEFFRTPPMKFSAAADTYAFGATAWYLANGGELPDQLLEEPPQTSSRAPSFGTLSLPIPPEIVALLDSTLAVSPQSRPDMEGAKEVIGRRLLYGKHRAVFAVDQQRRIELVEPNKSVVLRTGSDSLTVLYDGLSYRVTKAEGDAYINNGRALIGAELPKSCVVTLGHDSLGGARTFIAVDTSHPEVVL